MANVQVSQAVIEVAHELTAPTMQVSQVVIEVAYRPETGAIWPGLMMVIPEGVLWLGRGRIGG